MNTTSLGLTSNYGMKNLKNNTKPQKQKDSISFAGCYPDGAEFGESSKLGLNIFYTLAVGAIITLGSLIAVDSCSRQKETEFKPQVQNTGESKFMQSLIELKKLQKDTTLDSLEFDKAYEKALEKIWIKAK